MNIRCTERFFRSLIIIACAASLAAPAAAQMPAGNPPPGHPPMGGAGGMPSGHPPIGGAGGSGGAMPSGHGSAGAADMSKSTAPLTKKGKVLSVLDAKQFTYIEVQDGSAKPIWIASPAIAVKPGATIKYAEGDTMAKFHSKALNRDFTNVMFTTRVVIDK